MAEALISLARFALEEGGVEAAAVHPAEAETLARELGYGRLIVSAAGVRCRSPGDDARPLPDALAAHGDSVAIETRVSAHPACWRATGERQHLEVAHALLQRLLQQAPEESRERLVQRTTASREILAAWDEGAA